MLKRIIRDCLISVGLWRLIREPLRRLQSRALLFSARIGIYRPRVFKIIRRNSLDWLKEQEEAFHRAEKPSQMLAIAESLVMNASSVAEPCLAKLRGFRLPKDVKVHVERLSIRLAAIRNLPDLEVILNDEELLAGLYKEEGFNFFPHPSSGKLIVVFTTTFNNFGVSNAVIYAFLKKFDASVLFLKDNTIFLYGRGVVGLGENPDQVCLAVKRLAANANCDDIYLMGFSSGGYPALLFSSRLRCRGLLGFSVNSDSGFGSNPLPRTRILDDGERYTVRKKVSAEYLVNLRNVFSNENRGCSYTLIVGENSENDTIQAANLSDYPGFSIVRLENCGHDTVSSAIELKLMDGLILQLLRS